MAKEAKITLGGKEYLIHTFNIDELEEVSELLEKPTKTTMLKVLRIALRRAEPKIDDPGAVELSFDELAKANNTVLKLAGVDLLQNPPAAPVQDGA